MPRQTKTTPKISEKNTKNEILDAYQELLDQAATGISESETAKQEHAVMDTVAKETLEQVTTDLSKLRLSASQTISSLTEQLTSQAERFAMLQKAIAIAEKELEEINQIKTRAGMLRSMVEVQEKEEDKFQCEMDEKHLLWQEEQKTYEDQTKRERTREEEEYTYQKNLRVKRAKDAFEEEKRAWESDLQENKKLQEQQGKELQDLRKKAEQLPFELDKTVKTAVTEAVAQEKKEAQIRQNFAKQEWDSKQQVAALKIASLEQMVKSQAAEIEDLKRQLEKATQQVKDIAVTVIEGAKKASDASAKPPMQTTA